MSVGIPDIGDDIVFPDWRDRERIDPPVWWRIILTTLIIIVVVSPLVVVVVVVVALLASSLVHPLRVLGEPAISGEMSFLVTIPTLEASLVIIAVVVTVIIIPLLILRRVISRRIL